MDAPTYTQVQSMSPLENTVVLADQGHESPSPYSTSLTEGVESKSPVSLLRSNSQGGRQRTNRLISDVVFPLSEVNDAMNQAPHEDLVTHFQIRQIHQTALSTSDRFSAHKRSSVSSSPGPTQDANTGSSFEQIDTRDQSQLTSLRLFPSTHTSSNSSWTEQVETTACALYARLAAPISPYSVFSQVRYLVTLLVAATYVLFFPLEFAFPSQHFEYVNGIVGFLLGVDALVSLHTSYVRKDGTIAQSHRDIALHYLKTRFVPDALLVIPLLVHVHLGEIIEEWLHFVLDLLSAERLVYIIRFVQKTSSEHLHQPGGGHDLWAWLFYSRYSHLLRIAGTVAMVVCIAHYTACLWTALLEEADEYDEATGSWRKQYSASFYTALLLLQGDAIGTDTAAQNLFASLLVFIGSLVFAIMFGHVAILVGNFNANSSAYQRKMEEVYAMTSKLKLPPQLRERIHEYYEHLWHEYECIDGEIVQFSKNLSHTLGLEVVLLKYMDVVMHIPFWRDSTPSFQKQLMQCLDVRVYLPNDIIMREGEVDAEFYMINRGYCELTSSMDQFERVTTSMIPQATTTSKASSSSIRSRRRSSALPSLSMVTVSDSHLQSAYELDPVQRQYYSSIERRTAEGYEVLVARGQAFGDLALLSNYQRAATVRAITHVEMCILSRDSFQAVLTRYPADRRRVVVSMLSSYMESHEARQLPCPLLELVRDLYSAEAIAEARTKGGISCPKFTPDITAREAAEKIYAAMDVDMRDSTIKFGIGTNIREQLVDLRERRQTSRVDQGGRRDFMNINCARTQSFVEPTRPQDQQQMSWQARLQRVEEREVAMLHALKELQVSFKLLQACVAQATAHIPSTGAPDPPIGSRKWRTLPPAERFAVMTVRSTLTTS